MKTITARSYRIAMITFILFVALTTLSPTELSAEERSNYLVLFKEEIHSIAIDSVGGTVQDQFELFDSVLATLTTSEAAELRRNPFVETVEPDHQISIQNQWTNWGTNHIKTDTPRAQGLSGNGVKVAILDTGVSATHPDLHVTAGYNFIDNNTDFDDDNGHGSHVAGIIAAGQKDQGMIGVAPDVDLYVGKTMDEHGQGYYSSLIKGIEWAIDEDVDIINFSIGGDRYSSQLRRAIEVAADHDIVLVGAAGNKGIEANATSTVEYPAKFTEVIAVAATDSNDLRAPFSGYGPEVDVAAPGVNIKSTHMGTSYAQKSGTSMAAPFVTGMVAIMKEASPSKSAIEIKEQLLEWTKPLGTSTPNHYTGHGRIQFPTTILLEELPPEPVKSIKTDVIAINEQEAAITIKWEDHQHSSNTVVSYLLKRNGDVIYQGADRLVNDIVTEDGNYTYEVLVKNTSGMLSTPLMSGEVRIRLSDPFAELISRYKDMNEGDWYLPYMKTLTEQKLIVGYEDQTLRPDRSISRAEVSMILSRQQGWSNQVKNTVFPDVTKDHYASGAIAQAEKRGFIKGFPDGSFRPNEPILRADLAVLLNRIFTYSSGEFQQTFIDVGRDEYYSEAINLLAGASIIQGYEDQSFKPKKPLTRAEFATMLTRTMEQ